MKTPCSRALPCTKTLKKYKAKLEEPEFFWNDRYKALFSDSEKSIFSENLKNCMLEWKSATQSKLIQPKVWL